MRTILVCVLLCLGMMGYSATDNVMTGTVLRVNGIAVTADDYYRQIDMMIALAKIKNPKIEDDGRKIQNYRSKLINTHYRTLIQRMAITSKLFATNMSETVGLVSTGSVDTVKARYVRSFLPKSKKKISLGERFETLRKEIEKQGFGDLFERDFNLDVRLDAYFNTKFADRLTATAEEIADAKKSVEDYNKMASATNALQEALCAKLIERARAGEDFAELADEYSQDEDKEKGGVIGECAEVDFTGEPGYWEKVRKLPEGGISDLIATAEGYEIVKVNKIVSANNSASGSEALELSRIFRRMAYVFPAQPDDEFAADIIKEKREAFYKEFIRGIMKDSKVEYPQAKRKSKNQTKGEKQP